MPPKIHNLVRLAKNTKLTPDKEQLQFLATLYLTEQGSKLGKTSRRLVVEKNKKMLLEIPEFKVDRVLIFCNVQITTQAIAFLLGNGIETSFLAMQGRLKGKLTPIESKNVYLRIKQYERYHDDDFRLKIARSIILIEPKHFGSGYKPEPAKEFKTPIKVNKTQNGKP